VIRTPLQRSELTSPDMQPEMRWYLEWYVGSDLIAEIMPSNGTPARN